MYYRMLAVAAVAGALAGCSSQMQTSEASQEARLAAYAASSHYPSNLQARTDVRMGIMVNRSDGTLRVVNYSDQPVRNANIWVNRSFVHHVDTIPANGYVTLKRTDFYDGVGNNLSNLSTAVNQVQVQSDQSLYNTMGPVFE